MRGVNCGRFQAAVAAAVVLLAGCAAAVVVPGSPGAANPLGDVDCEQFRDHPECRLRAGVPRVAAPVVGSGGEVVCAWDGQVVPCRSDWGWFGGDGCYYRRLADQSPPAGARLPGAAYRPRCIGDPAGGQRPAVWLADGQEPGVAALGRLAVSRLVLPPPQVRLSPSPPAPQLAMLPVWLWVEPEWWVLRSASVWVPGVRVTATGAPVQVRWSSGDGTVLTCGAGTPYRDGGDPRAPSPDCGHVYTRSSAGQPGGAYRVEATVTWQVSWSGGGLAGSAGPLFSTATLSVPVSEVQTVIVP